jgi:uncharacterized membrane protein YczE
VPVTLAARPDSPLLRRLATLFTGLVLVGTGVALTITAEIGVAPYDVLSTGIAETFGIDIGIAAMILPCIFAGLGWALGGRVGPGTVLSVLFVGPILGLVLDVLPEDIESLWIRVPMFALGFLMISAGITGAVIAEIGPGPAEVLMLAVHGKGFELARTRTVIELASVAVGWALGGQVGVGTAIVALTIGPTLRSMLRWSGYRTATPDDKAICVEPGA